MEPLLPSQKVLPTAWSEVLDKVRHALECAAAEAARREEELDGACPVPSPAPEGWRAWDEALQRGQHGRQEWERIRKQAEQEAAEAAEGLAAGEDALRRWLGAAHATARKLADGAERGV